MATGRKQKRNKKVSSNEIKNRIIVRKMEKIDPLSPIVKVRTVAKPNCDQTIQAKKVSLNIKVPKASARKKSLSCKPGDGTIGAHFLTKGVKSKTRTADMRNGDGTHGVNFHK